MQRLAIIVFVAALGIGGSARTSHAGFLDGWADAIVTVMEGFSDPMLRFTGQMTDAMLRLSTDIGAMADRIGVMSDRIGVMADRIVATEELLAETLVTLAGARAQGGGAAVIMLEPRNGVRAERGAPPRITLSDQASSFVLYASPSPVFAPGEHMAVLVESARDLDEAWAQVVMLAGEEVYVAVASVNDMRLSGRSNSARLELVD